MFADNKEVSNNLVAMAKGPKVPDWEEGKEIKKLNSTRAGPGLHVFTRFS